MKTREITKVVKGSRQIDGAGVHLVRVFGYRDTKNFDPFLMLDAFDSTNPEDYIKGFPWHPHRGIETVTYLISGRIDHEDSLGNKGTITAGGCQWMTAGSGILHQEMPIASNRMLGAQLWVNLPAKDKMTEPKYRDITADMVPILKDENGEIKVISGVYKGTQGAMQADFVQVLYLDVMVYPGKTMVIPAKSNENVFTYIIDGNGTTGEKLSPIQSHSAVLFDKGEQLIFNAEGEGLRLFLLSGESLNEPIAWGGPVVMNTLEELNFAFEELENGTFIKHKTNL
ncbi:MAG: pirin family protein [Bacteroidia bacterium]|nr:pirin family protein [Bacteroidia bacterium]